MYMWAPTLWVAVHIQRPEDDFRPLQLELQAIVGCEACYMGSEPHYL